MPIFNPEESKSEPTQDPKIVDVPKDEKKNENLFKPQTMDMAAAKIQSAFMKHFRRRGSKKKGKKDEDKNSGKDKKVKFE